MWDTLWLDVRLATMEENRGAYGIIDDGALGISAGRIVFCGERGDLPGPPGTLARAVRRLDGRWMTPGLIDCHTHLVYGGDRADEFEARLEGASYEALLEAGHGILSTVRATRATGLESLVASALPRLDALLAEGITTIEIKSGYGLDLETECTMLRAARRLGEVRPVTVVTTFLGAHALPPEFEGRKGDYVDFVCETVMPEIAGLADAVDAFCEHIAFTPEEIDRVFAKAGRLGLPVKLHAEQLSDSGGAEVAARHGALSCDHLEYLSEAGARAMAQAGTVAVLLPGAASRSCCLVQPISCVPARCRPSTSCAAIACPWPFPRQAATALQKHRWVQISLIWSGHSFFGMLSGRDGDERRSAGLVFVA